MAPTSPTSMTKPPTQASNHFCKVLMPKIHSHQDKRPTMAVANKILTQFVFILTI